MARPRGRRIGPARFPCALAVACLTTVTACGDPELDTARLPPTAQPTVEETNADGALAQPDRAENAFTYDPPSAPEGARIAVAATSTDASTQVRLQVQGLLPNRGYAAHAHARACGPTGDAAGPHHQHEPDPAATPQRPSTDPAYANPQNEIWLDLRTDDAGNARTGTVVPFVPTERAPASVVIHAAETTATGPGVAGTAGGRVACLNVPFG
jgi:superoxide dismutase, Cu-Zn family